STGRADKVASPRPALEAELLQLRLVGEIHHDVAVRALADDIRVAALAARGGFGAGPVLGLVIGGITPAPDHLRRADRGGDLRSGQRLHCRRIRGGRRAPAETAETADPAGAAGER